MTAVAEAATVTAVAEAATAATAVATADAAVGARGSAVAQAVAAMRSSCRGSALPELPERQVAGLTSWRPPGPRTTANRLAGKLKHEFVFICFFVAASRLCVL